MASTMASGLLGQHFLRSFRRDPDLGVVPLQENTERERETRSAGGRIISLVSGNVAP